MFSGAGGGEPRGWDQSRQWLASSSRVRTERRLTFGGWMTGRLKMVEMRRTDVVSINAARLCMKSSSAVKNLCKQIVALVWMERLLTARLSAGD